MYKLFRTNIIHFFIIACTSLIMAHAQDSLSSSVTRIGVYGGPQFNFYSGQFQVFDGSSICGTFDKGNGTGYAAAALIDIPIGPSFFVRGLLGFNDYKGTFKSNVRLASAILPDGTLTDATAEETLDAKLSYITFLPAIVYYPFKSYPIHFQAGTSIGIVSKKTFEQREVLTAPIIATFNDGTQNHIITSGPIASTNGVRAGINLGAGYDLFLMHNLILAPQVNYDLPLTKVTSDTKWNAASLGVGISLMWALVPAPVVIPPPPPPPVERKIPEPPIVELKKEGTTPSGLKSNVKEIVLEEIRTTERRPLLPYIFFDQGDANRPLRQTTISKDDTKNFTLGKIRGNDLEIYPHLLNIFGERLKNNPRATITLTGTNNGYDVEKNNSTLSKQRAETIKNYFVTVWDIDPKRITVQSRNLPLDATAPDAPEGHEENRRVEISSSDKDVLEPIARDERQNSLSIASVDFMARVTAEAGLSHWDFNVKQDNKILYQADGTQADIPAIMRWDLQQKPIDASEHPVTVDFVVHDKLSREKSIHDEIPVRTLTIEKKREERIGDMLVNRSGLIVFDFDKATLSERNRKIIDEIKPAITPQSNVTIIGYTDALGDADHNLKLSLQRAQAVRDVLGSVISEHRLTVEGKGSTKLLYSNDTPEGRFYCRMVQIVIETPVK